jgi:regulator of nucleoside diphosphate kinase
MNTPIPGERTLTELDHVRIAALLRRAPASLDVQALVDEADLVASRDVAPDVVTMYSQVVVADVEGADVGAARRALAVCYPPDADPDAGFLSVLSPLGAALVGRRVGDRVRWATPDGATHEAEVVAVLFQPEASGDYTT